MKLVISCLAVACAALLWACSLGNSPSVGEVVSIEWTSTSTWAEPQPFHWQLHIAKGGAAELRDFHDGKPRLRAGQLGAAQFQKLGEFLEDMRFGELGSGSEPSSRSSDPARDTLVVQSSTGTKSVSSVDGAGPANLWVLLQALSGIVHNTSWRDAQ